VVASETIRVAKEGTKTGVTNGGEEIFTSMDYVLKILGVGQGPLNVSWHIVVPLGTFKVVLTTIELRIHMTISIQFGYNMPCIILRGLFNYGCEWLWLGLRVHLPGWCHTC